MNSSNGSGHPSLTLTGMSSYCKQMIEEIDLSQGIDYLVMFE